jgi:hypothetical protein
MWQRKDYEDAAASIGKQFADSGGNQSIVDLSVKVAQDNNLSPDGIRTLVRLANVSAFQELFTKEAGEDRMIEFQVGEPELVISKLYQNTKTAAAREQATPNGYDRAADYFGDLPRFEKIAEDDDTKEIADEELEEETKPDAPVVDKKRVKLLFQKSKDKVKEEAKEAELRWYGLIEKAAQTLRVYSGGTPSFSKVAFERNMVASGGEDILTEVKALRLYTGVKEGAVLGGQKVATVLDTHVAILSPHEKTILGYLKEAADMRHHRDKCNRGLTLLDSKMRLL